MPLLVSLISVSASMEMNTDTGNRFCREIEPLIGPEPAGAVLAGLNKPGIRESIKSILTSFLFKVLFGLSYVALDPKKEEKEWMSATSRGGESKVAEYVLPDGKKLKVGPERFRAPEILFDPELIGLEWPGLHQIVVDSINRTDMDLRKSLFGNIVLSGGSTMIKGFGDRLLHEVQRLAVKDMRIKIFAPPERLYSTWIGGSILAGLSTFRKMYVSIDDWHESKRSTCLLNDGQRD